MNNPATYKTKPGKMVSWQAKNKSISLRIAASQHDGDDLDQYGCTACLDWGSNFSTTFGNMSSLSHSFELLSNLFQMYNYCPCVQLQAS